ncbi:hypothetical protein [Pseudofulvimonas gallinarii]|uniref:Uncharacterized protein n=1 Tax=Pseudofulvimonas gallinarii TaxID=634155 RepID=A0A4S3KW59_9GAMM|nr:hypothetical protein [Pseudofulvimonas gallinarii]TCT00049.1 hypothetical protein EDC25_10436 [Pseudofulvimonas gallinarii]THD13525.1 hypothetical protein B1808_07185 [Pseudofulvimonas gallinarii]
MFNRKWVRGLVIIPVTLAAYLAGSRFPAGLPSDYAVASPDAEASAVTRLEPDPADAAVGHVRALSATPTVTPNDVVASRSSDLPAADVPVLQLIEQLEPRARRGDARAACRLGVELLRCRNHSQQENIQNLLRSAVQQRRGEISDFELDLLAKMEDRQLASRRRCEGIGPEHWRRAVEHQRIAAE